MTHFRSFSTNAMASLSSAYDETSKCPLSDGAGVGALLGADDKLGAGDGTDEIEGTAEIEGTGKMLGIELGSGGCLLQTNVHTSSNGRSQSASTHWLWNLESKIEQSSPVVYTALLVGSPRNQFVYTTGEPSIQRKSPSSAASAKPIQVLNYSFVSAKTAAVWLALCIDAR